MINASIAAIVVAFGFSLLINVFTCWFVFSKLRTQQAKSASLVKAEIMQLTKEQISLVKKENFAKFEILNRELKALTGPTTN
jgi:hypothetical protein